MFSARDEASPSLLASGDRVRWRAIERAEFSAMEAAALRGEKGTTIRKDAEPVYY